MTCNNCGYQKIQAKNPTPVAIMCDFTTSQITNAFMLNVLEMCLVNQTTGEVVDRYYKSTLQNGDEVFLTSAGNITEPPIIPAGYILVNCNELSVLQVTKKLDLEFRRYYLAGITVWDMPAGNVKSITIYLHKVGNVTTPPTITDSSNTTTPLTQTGVPAGSIGDYPVIINASPYENCFIKAPITIRTFNVNDLVTINLERINEIL